MEQRIVELESKLAFQDHTVEQLNQVVIAQQREIDQLHKEVERLKQQFKTLAEQASQSHNFDDEPPPPHY